MIKLERIDHFVMRVADVGATCSFYEKVLGMEVITFNGKDGVVRLLRRFASASIKSICTRTTPIGFAPKTRAVAVKIFA